MKEEQEAVSSPDRVVKGESEMEEEEEAIRVIIKREKGIVALVKWWRGRPARWWLSVSFRAHFLMPSEQ